MTETVAQTDLVPSVSDTFEVFGDGAPEKIEDNPEYTPFYIDKVNGGFLDNYPSDKKDDYVFGGYRVKGTELISYTPLAEGFLKKLGEGVESVDITSISFIIINRFFRTAISSDIIVDNGVAIDSTRTKP